VSTSQTRTPSLSSGPDGRVSGYSVAIASQPWIDQKSPACPDPVIRNVSDFNADAQRTGRHQLIR
jgi:hypothetical protein